MGVHAKLWIALALLGLSILAFVATAQLASQAGSCGGQGVLCGEEMERSSNEEVARVLGGVLVLLAAAFLVAYAVDRLRADRT